MSFDEKDFESIRIARPVAIVDLWDIDDRISRLEEALDRLENILRAFILLYHEERVKNWELILREMLRKEEQKKKGNTDVHRTG